MAAASFLARAALPRFRGGLAQMGNPASPAPKYTFVYGTTFRTCAICLEEYAAGDELRVLEACGHCFHSKCVNTWLSKGKSTCPICVCSASAAACISPSATSTDLSAQAHTHSMSNEAAADNHSDNGNNNNTIHTTISVTETTTTDTDTDTTHATTTTNTNLTTASASIPPTAYPRPTVRIQLIDLSVHDSWIEWIQRIIQRRQPVRQEHPPLSLAIPPAIPHFT